MLAALLPAAAAMRPLYPVKAALRTGTHAVADGVHELYYEEHGRADGAPALFLHGGPGAGCFQRHAGFFDPAHYRVILFDQRGCGRSKPKGCLDANDTPGLVADIEELRCLLGVEAWHVVLGGSWGTTLALAYAQARTTHAAATSAPPPAHRASSAPPPLHQRNPPRRRTRRACGRSCCVLSASCASARSGGSLVRAAARLVESAVHPL